MIIGKLKIIFLFLLLNILNAFEVEFTKVYTEYVVPKKDAILIQTKKDDLTFPFKYIKTKQDYLLIGDMQQINLWLDNEFYAPDDAKFKNIKVAYLNNDKIQYKVINQIKRNYKSCKIKKIIFLTPNENKIITTPKTIKLKYKVILNCK